MNMIENAVLRTTRFGQKGFVIEDVNNYIDKINERMMLLEEENARLKNEIERLKSKSE